MKELWFVAAVLLMLGVLAGFSGMQSPSSSIVVNLPPQWDFPTTEFPSDESGLELDLKQAFFDPDGDPLSFSVSPGPGVTAGVYGEMLAVVVEDRGEVTITVSDGKSLISKKITVYRK